jgi:hypothetical protein
MPVFDPKTGIIDKRVVRQWAKFDITRQVTRQWEQYGPVVLNKVHLACGELDSYYLNRAVERFKDAVEKLNADQPHSGSGYVLIVEKADHGSIIPMTFQRWNKEMRAHLQAHGLQDPDPPTSRPSDR